MNHLSSHFTFEEAVISQTATRKGIDNTPSPEVKENMVEAAQRMEEVRDLLDAPILVSSWFRCPKLNSAIGGASTSAHVQGGAIDFTAPQFGTPQDVCRKIQASGLTWDQLIFEGTWTHISFDPKQRMQVMTAHFVGGRTTYTQGVG